MAPHTQRKVLSSTIVAAWLVGAMLLGRLVHEYVPGVGTGPGAWDTAKDVDVRRKVRIASKGAATVELGPIGMMTTNHLSLGDLSHLSQCLVMCSIGAAALAFVFTVAGIRSPPIEPIATSQAVWQSVVQLEEPKSINVDACLALTGIQICAATAVMQNKATKLRETSSEGAPPPPAYVAPHPTLAEQLSVRRGSLRREMSGLDQEAAGKRASMVALVDVADAAQELPSRTETFADSCRIQEQIMSRLALQTDELRNLEKARDKAKTKFRHLASTSGPSLPAFSATGQQAQLRVYLKDMRR